MSAIRITGQVRSAARVAVDAASGAAWVLFSLELPSPGERGRTRALVRHQVGSGYAAQYTAARRARQLRRGATCTVHAAGIERNCTARLDALRAYPASADSAPDDHLLLMGVDWIDVE